MLDTAPIPEVDEPEELCPEPPPRTDEERQAWYREGIESWREFKRTGLHVTWEEMEAWMKTWGNEEMTEPPECHT